MIINKTYTFRVNDSIYIGKLVSKTKSYCIFDKTTTDNGLDVGTMLVPVTMDIIKINELGELTTRLREIN